MFRSSTNLPLRTAICTGLLGTAALCVAPAVLADDANLLTDPFSISLGTYIVQTDPTVQLNGDTTDGDRVNFQDHVGGADVTRLRLDAGWRFGDTDKHKLKGFIFDVNRRRSETIDRDIEWGGNTYPVDAKVNFSFDFSIIELAYEYEFLKRDNYEIGASAGLHFTSFSAGLSAKAAQSGGTLETDLKNEGSVDLPLPVFGLQGTWKLPYNFYANLSGQWFALSIDEYDGDVQDYRAVLTWQPKKWLGVGIGYDRFAVNVDVKKQNFKGSLDWTYSGPMIFYNASF
jgi:hypothetical protein